MNKADYINYLHLSLALLSRFGFLSGFNGLLVRCAWLFFQ